MPVEMVEDDVYEFTTEIEDNTTNSNNLTTNKTPVFLTLSPYMDELDFKNELNKLNDLGQLVNSHFIVKINSKDYIFDIKKEPNAITIVNSSNISKHLSELNIEISKNLNYTYWKKLEPIIDLYRSKYELYSKQIPMDINLKHYGFDFSHYHLFEDDDKFILLCYSVSNLEILSYEEIEEYKKRKEKEYPEEDPIIKLFSYSVNPVSKNDYYNFGYDLEVKYYPKEYLSYILTNIINKGIEAREKQINKEKEIVESENKKVNNINEL